MNKSQITDAMVYCRQLVGEHVWARLPTYHHGTDYIGPEALTKHRVLSPLTTRARRVFGVDFNVAGWLHDGLYLIGGDELAREAADGLFRLVMLWLIDQQLANAWSDYLTAPRRAIKRRSEKAAAQGVAAAYFETVRACGKSCFCYRPAPATAAPNPGDDHRA